MTMTNKPTSAAPDLTKLDGVPLEDQAHDRDLRDESEFDQWLSGELRRLFDPMLDEPTPDSMLQALADALARRGVR